MPSIEKAREARALLCHMLIIVMKPLHLGVGLLALLRGFVVMRFGLVLLAMHCILNVITQE